LKLGVLHKAFSRKGPAPTPGACRKEGVETQCVLARKGLLWREKNLSKIKKIPFHHAFRGKNVHLMQSQKGKRGDQKKPKERRVFNFKKEQKIS